MGEKLGMAFQALIIRSQQCSRECLVVLIYLPFLSISKLPTLKNFKGQTSLLKTLIDWLDWNTD